MSSATEWYSRGTRAVAAMCQTFHPRVVDLGVECGIGRLLLHHGAARWRRKGWAKVR